MPAEPAADRLLTVDEVASRLACSRKTVYRLCWSGALESVKRGPHRRVLESALRQYIGSLTTPASPPAEGTTR